MIKTILVPATGAASDLSVFASALTVARAFGAHLDFLYTGIVMTIGAMLSSETTSAKLIAELIERVETAADQRKHQVRRLLGSFCQSEQLVVAETPTGGSAASAGWFNEIGTEPNRVAEYGHAADLLVIGRSEGGESIRSETLQAARLNSGRPLLIPTATPIATLPATVVVGWEGKPETARGVTAAIPFLSKAKQIIIATVAEDKKDTEKQGALRLMAGLGWHGFPVSVQTPEPNTTGLAESLFSAAREQSALLVMGGYGHSRLREWIFGGFTQRVLRGAEVPVLITH